MQNQSVSKRQRVKLGQLVELEGYASPDELLKAAALDSVSPAICTNENYDYRAEMEPDQDRSFCEVCGTNTVASALVLAGLI